MSSIVEFPGSLTKKGGAALIHQATHVLKGPLTIAAACRDEFQAGKLRHLNDNLLARQLPSAKHNHARMLARAAVVDATHTALMSVTHLARPISRASAIQMLVCLFGALVKSKSGDARLLLEACVDMIADDDDVVGECTGLWLPIPRSPVVVGLAVKKLITELIFTPSPAELRTALRDVKRRLLGLMNATDRWIELLRLADQIVFEHDRAAWNSNYQNVGADVLATMQSNGELPDTDDDGEPIAASPRWTALEALRDAKLIT